MFETLLIAGGCDIARRVERTCKRIGIDLAATTHAEASDSPTDVGEVLAAAVRAGATAVFPAGLSATEALSLAQATQEAGLVFIGPSTESLMLFADKAALRSAVEHIGAAVQENPGAAARHLEVTVVVDAEGAGLALVEREVSVRDDAGCLLVETPAALFSLGQEAERRRAELAAAALEIAKGVGLRGLATFRFVSDPQGRLHFLDGEAGSGEAALALELVIQADPIEIQLEVAAGRPVRSEVSLRATGHAFEAHLRVDTHLGSGPDEAPITELAFPPVPQAKARIEPLVEVGDTPQGEPAVLAKVASLGPVRHQAMLGLDRILAETRVAPAVTNIPFLRRVLNHDSFRAGQYDAGFGQRINER